MSAKGTDPTRPAGPARPSPSPIGGLAGLDVLPLAKARLARRLVAGGCWPAAADFDQQGLTLAADELRALLDWLRGGLGTSVVERVEARDGTVRLGVALHDARRIETVVMPIGAVCVSTQVGCAVGCRFCASGLFGVERNLLAGEIVEQVVHARRELRVERVVYMGMGEPSHNLAAVLDAVAAIKEVALIGPKRQTVSTVGSLATIAAMQQAPVRPCLALSLHSVDDERRSALLPRAHRDRVADMIPAADAYGREIGMPVQFEWTLLEGINDRDEDIDAMCSLLQGVRGYLNFIVWNPVEGLLFKAPSRDRIVAIVRRVKAAGILATIRDSSGPDVDAACGQLRLREHATGVPAAPSRAPASLPAR